jgi:hypothetical protein
MALGPTLSPLPTPRPQQPGLDEALMPMQGSGEAVVAQNYNGWRNLLSNPAMTAAMLQYAVSLTGDTGRGTAGDIANALGAAGGAAGRTAEAEKKRADEQKALEAQQAQQQLENDMAKQRLDLEKQRVDIARGAARRGGGGGSGSKTTDPVKLAETQWKEAYKAWAAAEPLPGQPDTRGPAPDLNDYIFRQQDIQAAVANGMNYGDYKAAEGVDPALAQRLLTGYKAGTEQGQKVIDEFLGQGDPTMDAGREGPPAASLDKTSTPPPDNSFDLPALEPGEPPTRVITGPPADTAGLAKPARPWTFLPELRALDINDALWSRFSEQQQATLLDNTVPIEVKKAIVFAKRNFTGGFSESPMQ